MEFKLWLENTFENDAQEMWDGAYELLYLYKNMNKALAEYCLGMLEMESPIQVGRILGLVLQHAPHYTITKTPVDRNEVFKFLGSNPQAEEIKKAALFAYSTYEPPQYTLDTIKKLG